MSLALISPTKTRKSRNFIYFFALAFILFFGWASYFEIDQSIRAQGQIIALDRTQVIQSPDAGVINEINVKEGETVKKGQSLVVLEKERANAAFSDTLGKVAALRITLSRLQAEVYGKPLFFASDLRSYREFISNQTDLYKRRKQAIDEEVASMNASLRLAKEELEMNLPLLKDGDVGKADILRLKRQVSDIEGQITTKKNKYFQDAQAEMTKAQEELSTQEQNLLDRKQLLEHTELVAPMNGIVKKISVSTLGAVVKPGDEVLELLPTQSDLIVEAKIQPIDMSHLVIGLPALIKLDAYDYSIYGSMIGEVEYISPDTLSEQTRNGETVYYKAKIRIKEKEFNNKFAHQIKINPGMTVTVDIKTGKRSVLAYLTKPVTKTLSESMTEK